MKQVLCYFIILCQSFIPANKDPVKLELLIVDYVRRRAVNQCVPCDCLVSDGAY